ncbi:MAG TPA: alpha/beta hydrolase [Bryobacteraceae bacterium]
MRQIGWKLHIKLLLLVLLIASASLSIWILLPAPNLMLLPVAIVALEFSPWLAAFNLIAGVAALRFHRGIAAAFLVLLLVSTLPVVQAFRIPRPRHTAPAAGRPIVQESLPLGIRHYRPEGEGPFPALIDIYGGAWQFGSAASDATFNAHLASRGYAVYALEYRHAPAARYPAQIEDVRAAIAFIRENAPRYRTDAARLAVCGRSSGGELALLAAYGEGSAPLRGAISIYGPTDLALGYSDVPSPDPIHVRSVLETYLGGSPAQVPELYRSASPVNYVRAGLPPTLLIQGGRDHIVKARFALELHGKLRAAGNRSTLLEIPWGEHAFDLAFDGIGNRIVLEYVESFLSDVLR